jgi:tetratricopeptide (TPR) repeat protein
VSDTQLAQFLSPAAARQIDQTCDRFEAAWKAGRRPRPEEYLGTTDGAERSALLRQLLLLDWDYRRRAGDDPQADDYRIRFPGDATLIEDVSREMSGSPDSTADGTTGPPLPHAPGSRERTTGLGGEVTASARYDLLQEVGCGGIGVVFRARDRVLGRDLAVKVLREGFRDRPDARSRFVEEARIGSRLQHPAIVPVYELGAFGDGRPYFTMKLVEGHTLAVLLRNRADPGQDLARWLAIFEQVCQAVAYAHSKGVIHRDLKPANVMVGAFGEVQVMDWGFAKEVGGGQWAAGSEDAASGATVTRSGARDLADATADGAIMGTPAYMPPEQARGQAALVDARADVFALGAILCEILTGRPPYVGGDDEVCHQAAEADLDGAEARLDACGSDEDLRALARRCLVADRRGRPADAGAVAGDLTAYLASSQDRLRKAQVERAAAEARAHAERRARRLTVALAAAAVLLVVGAAAAPVVGFVLLRTEQKETETQRRAAVAAREDEARRRQVTRQALDMLAGPVIEDWLGKQVSVTPEQRQFLERALAIYAGFAAETETDEASRAGLAHAYHRVGTIQFILGRLTEAGEAYDRGAELYTRLDSESPGRPEYRKGLARLLTSRNELWAATGRGERAEAGLRDFGRLQRQWSADSGDPEYRAMLALSLSRLGWLSLNRGKLSDAEALSREAVTVYEELAAEHAGQLAVRHGRAVARHTLAMVLENTGRPAEAEEAYRDVLKQRRQLVADSPGVSQVRREVGQTLSNLAALLRRRGRAAEAEAVLHEAIEVYRQLTADFPAIPGLQSDTAIAYQGLGNVLASLSRLADAEKAYRRAIELGQGLTDESPHEPDYQLSLALAQFGLGIVMKATDRMTEAEAAEREAARLFRALAEADPAVPEYRNYHAASLVNLAQWHKRRGELADARRLLAEALPHHQAAIRARPLQANYRQILCANRVTFAQTFHAEKDHAGLAEAAGQLAEAAAEAAELSSGATVVAAQFPYELMRAAVFLAHSAAYAERDARLPEARRAELARSYAERAMATLRLAVKHGYQDAAKIKSQAAFQPMLSRPDFRELLAELEKVGKMP